MVKKKYIVGNWKMNPLTSREARELFSAVSRRIKKTRNVVSVVCPPSVYLEVLGQKKSSLLLGAQDSFYEYDGSYTGQISPAMVRHSGAGYVIIGHSERRALGETDEVVRKKISKSLKENLRVIFCVGEKERDAEGKHFKFVSDEIENALRGLKPKDFSSIIVAYEPIWAIGRSAKDAMLPADMHEMLIFIKKVLTDMKGAGVARTVPILYGGSVNSEIAAGILKEGHADGLLIGRTSLDSEDFSKIIAIANEL